jgi:hypothetical protein
MFATLYFFRIRSFDNFVNLIICKLKWHNAYCLCFQIKLDYYNGDWPTMNNKDSKAEIKKIPQYIKRHAPLFLSIERYRHILKNIYRINHESPE